MVKRLRRSVIANAIAWSRERQAREAGFPLEAPVSTSSFVKFGPATFLLSVASFEGGLDDHQVI